MLQVGWLLLLKDLLFEDTPFFFIDYFPNPKTQIENHLQRIRENSQIRQTLFYFINYLKNV